MRARRPAAVPAALLLTLSVGVGPVAASQADEARAARFAQLALDCVHREYPNKIAHVLDGDGDARPPRELTPAFYGCYDWHSSVHGHWLLVRLARLHPHAETAAASRAALARSLTVANLQGEAAYMQAPGRTSFERPYGLAWLLQLGAELREWDDPDARRWRQALAPTETLAAERIRDWLPKLTHPIRSGEHSQTAFAFGLILDWARRAGDGDMITLLEKRVADYYAADYDCPLRYEPSGQDFLSPCLAEADLLRRVRSPAAFADWLTGFLPGIPADGSAQWLEPAVVTDPTDGKLVHLDGLNLSRAWMLEGIASGLPADDDRRHALLAAAAVHRASGLAAVTGVTYESGHWLGTFATYLITGRGVDASTAP
ncbi:MAG: DUF2891 domain-containing protein [Acidobacteria bacterium]|nr:DUF2891 domain-containing protein [Acidobacteriota bacterium]